MASRATVAWPESTSVPATACATPWTAAAATRTRWRGSRSAQTPAATVISAAAPWREAITTPTKVGEPVTCSTANTSATVETPSPNAEIGPDPGCNCDQRGSSLARGDHHPDQGRRAGHLQHREHERHGGDAVAKRRDRPRPRLQL